MRLLRAAPGLVVEGERLVADDAADRLAARSDRLRVVPARPLPQLHGGKPTGWRRVRASRRGGGERRGGTPRGEDSPTTVSRSGKSAGLDLDAELRAHRVGVHPFVSPLAAKAGARQRVDDAVRPRRRCRGVADDGEQVEPASPRARPRCVQAVKTPSMRAAVRPRRRRSARCRRRKRRRRAAPCPSPVPAAARSVSRVLWFEPCRSSPCRSTRCVRSSCTGYGQPAVSTVPSPARAVAISCSKVSIRVLVARDPRAFRRPDDIDAEPFAQAPDADPEPAHHAEREALSSGPVRSIARS